LWFRKQPATGPSREQMREMAAQQAARAEETQAALENGQLPPYVRERILSQKGQQLPWTSDLTVNEWALCKSYGLQPLGQVMGSSYYKIAYSVQSSFGTYGSFQMVEQERAVLAGRARALSRLQDEAALLGANAVVGVRVRIYRPPVEGQEMEFSAFGTAVKVAGLPLPNTPVLCTTNAQSLVKLMESGAFPVGLAIGVCVQYQYTSRDDMWQVRSWNNQEMRNWTQASNVVRMEALQRMMQQAKAIGASGVLAHDTAFSVMDVEVERGQNDRRIDHVLQFVSIGTAVMAKRQPTSVGIDVVIDAGKNKSPEVNVNL